MRILLATDGSEYSEAAVDEIARRQFPADSDVRVISVWPRSPGDLVLGIGFSAGVLLAYEQVGQAFGLDVGSVETSSMALLRGLESEGDCLLVRHDPAWLTLTLTRNGWPLSIRSFDAAVARKPEEVPNSIKPAIRSILVTVFRMPVTIKDASSSSEASCNPSIAAHS